MSISVMTKVWNTCCYRDGTLVLLLAMADIAEDDGTEIYPGMDFLAAKCRSSIRAVQDRIKQLRADGVAKLVGQNGADLPKSAAPTGGRGRKTEYRIDLERLQELQALHMCDNSECEHCIAREKRVRRRATKDEGRNEKGEIARAPYRLNSSYPSSTLPHDGAPACAIPQAQKRAENSSDGQPVATERNSKWLAKLVGMFEPDVFNVWFKGASFREGPPLTLVLAKRFYCDRVRDKFGDRLRLQFNDDLVFDYERER